MGRLAPVASDTEKLKRLLPFSRHFCDRCGFSLIDGGAISDAKYEIVTVEGSIFLCSHHMHEHHLYILEHAYLVRSSDDSA